MTQTEIRKALDEPGKSSRKALAKLSLELETDDPAQYRSILTSTHWTGEAQSCYKTYRRAYVFSRIAMVLAAVIVAASYLISDFGLGLLTGWLNRYAMAIGIFAAMALFAGGSLYYNVQKDRLIAYGLLEMECK